MRERFVARHAGSPQTIRADTTFPPGSVKAMRAHAILSARSFPSAERWYRKYGIGRFFRTASASGASMTGAGPFPASTVARQSAGDGFFRIAPKPYRNGPNARSPTPSGRIVRKCPRPGAGGRFPVPSSGMR